jgi:hypothetical protein
MRYYEISGHDPLLTEGAILTTILNGLKSQIGKQAHEKIELVSNTKTAAVVLYSVLSNREYAAKAQKLLRRMFRERMRAIPKGRYRRALLSQYPTETGPGAVIKALCIAAIMAGVTKASALTVNQIVDQGIDFAVDKVLSLNSALSMLATGVGLFQIFNVLHVGNEVLFALLTEIAEAIDLDGTERVAA